jgi:hypothetical protein
MQLDLFSQVFDEKDPDDILTEKANKLLDMLNEGRKKKELFESYLFTQVENLIVLVAIDRDKKMMGNVLDLDGNTPSDMCVNWRILPIVRKDLDQHFKC